MHDGPLAPAVGAAPVTPAAAWPFSPLDRPSKIVCVGRNYAEHARELGNAVPEEPVLFLKPTSSLVPDGGAIVVPAGVGAVHHEVELGVVVGARLKGGDRGAASDAVRGFALAIDVTARDVQDDAKRSGRPWTVAKGYDTFCPVSRLLGRDEVNPRAAALQLLVDDALRQDGNTADMLWPVEALLTYISGIMTLEPGDLVLTGTPKGVGPLAPGQRVEARLDGRTLLRLQVVGA